MTPFLTIPLKSGRKNAGMERSRGKMSDWLFPNLPCKVSIGFIPAKAGRVGCSPDFQFF